MLRTSTEGLNNCFTQFGLRPCDSGQGPRASGGCDMNTGMVQGTQGAGTQGFSCCACLMWKKLYCFFILKVLDAGLGKRWVSGSVGLVSPESQSQSEHKHTRTDTHTHMHAQHLCKFLMTTCLPQLPHKCLCSFCLSGKQGLGRQCLECSQRWDWR